jgi:ribonucleoside-diphosphate reductase alpha chain
MAQELFDEEAGQGGESTPASGGAKGKKATAPASSRARTTEVAESASSSTEPGGGAPLMAAPTSPANYAAPELPERVVEAQSGAAVPNIFAGEGLTFERVFTEEGKDVFETTEWELRTAAITDERGAVVFEQKDCEIPKSWSMLATNVVVSKYFRGKVGTPQREKSVRQIVSRVADTIHKWGKQGGYFATDADATAFHDELKYLLLHQYMAFNSPVWFNLGVPGERPQVSACQPYDAPVSTPQGLIPIGKLVEENAVGTVVYDAHGTTRVVATKANGRKQVLRLHTMSGYTVDVTPDHLVWKKTGGGKQAGKIAGKFVEAGTVKQGDKLVWHRTPLSGKSLEGSQEEAEAALAGWLQSDGFVGQYQAGPNRSLTVEAITVNDDEENWVRAAFCQVFPEAHSHTRAVVTRNDSLDCKRIRLYGEHLRPFVEKWNLMARGTAMQVPTALFTAPYAVAAAYLRSLFQAEGYVILRENASVGLDMISEDLVRGVQRLLLRFGIYSRVRFKGDARDNRKGCWCLKIATLGDRRRFAQEIGFVGTEKAEKLRAGLSYPGLEEQNFKTLTVERVENLGEMEVYDIQTESGEYLSGNIRVHNCFINSVDDTMESILTLAKTEGMLFKWGSGTGTNFSVLRSSRESLKGGGTASGPVSFMRGFDAFAGAIKSGGKCFKQGTMVATPRGWVAIETLSVGDVVLTHKGPRPVADFMPNGIKQCFRVRTEEGYELEVTAGHKFAFWNELTGKFDVKPIEEFANGEAMYVLTEASEGGRSIPLTTPEIAEGVNSDSVKEMRFPSELNDKLAYVAGLMYGDGELRTAYPYRVRVAFCKDAAGQQSAERFRAYCGELFGEEPLLLGDEKNYQQIGYTRKHLIDFLATNGLAKGKAHDLGFPTQLFEASPEVRAAFLAGLLDADGTYQQRGGWSLSGIDRAFMVQVQRLLLTLGVPSKLRVSRVAKGAWQTLYRLHIIGHTFIERLVERIKPYSAKAQVNYIPSPGADKGWGYRPSQLPALVARVEKRGGYSLIERRVGTNETTGYGALLAVAQTHPHTAVASYAAELSRCVQVRLQSVSPTEEAETYDIEVEDAHLLCANGLYASNTRRAAKMVILNADHPDVEDFIECKADAEKKAHALIEAGYSGAFNVANGAYDSVFFQNANHSVRATDDFMRAVELDRDWTTCEVTTGKPSQTIRARDLMRKISEAAWVCGDPGMQFDTTINRWHPCPNTARINASNPCCFVGETLVNTTEGLIRFDRLYEMDRLEMPLPVVPSWDKSAKTARLQPIRKVWIAGYTTNLVEVETEDGAVLRCTPEHRFLTAEDEYVPAEDLTPGTPLRRLHQFGKSGKADRQTDDAIRAYDLVREVRIVTLSEPVAVYDLEVAETHNFSVLQEGAAGNFAVVVSNSEYMFLDDSACNLASLNLMRFRREDREFDVELFKHAVRVTITAMEIMVSNAAYPTDKITVNSYDYRPLGLGYANLGALLMARGYPYDSDEGRSYAAAITSIMSGEAYNQSAKMAHRVGPFAGYERNRQPFLRVMKMHRDSVEEIHGRETLPAEMLDAARESWDAALSNGTEYGFRNGQISVLAPTGCLVPNSLVDRGLMRLNRLGNVSGAQWQDVSFGVLTDEGVKRATKFYVNGQATTRRITTRSGYAIQGTEKHQVKVVDAAGRWTWKRFDALQPGDVVPLSLGELIGTPQTVTLPPLGEEYWTGDYTTRAPRTMTPDLAELIGYFMGDGSLHSKGPRFCVANTDADVAERVRHLVKELFNLDVRITPQEGYHEVAVHSVPMVLWWEACGFAKHAPSENHSGKGYLPHVPDAVLATNDPAVYGAFLRGLYEADGTVTGGVPCWTTVNRDFADEVKTLLLALGIPTSTKTDTTGWGNSTAYCLRLRNSSYAFRFVEAVGFMGERKREKVSLRVGEQTARHDYIYLDPATLDELVPKHHPLYNAVYLARQRHGGAITRRAALSLYAETGDARLGHALRFFYDTVEANEDGGVQPTYDLSVPENVTYVAQGFVSHNTIGFLMDCDTTGVEPDIAIVKYKTLVGGGMFKIVNQTVPEALERLGYSAGERKAILEYIEQNDTIEGAPGFSDEHLPIFDCAFRPRNGVRSIHYMGHIRMMAAVQPFLSGAISKTVNLPHEATADDISDAYLAAWKLGVKALAIYRDGSKKTQPLSTGKTSEQEKAGKVGAVIEARPFRRKLPDERQSLTHKFSVGGHEGYLTVGLYPDNSPGEIFITMSKEGSVVSGLMDSFATSISLALQYGVPLRTLVEKFMHTRFEPSGFTGNPDIPMAKSIMDYLFRYLALKFLDRDERRHVGLIADQADEYDNGGLFAETEGENVGKPGQAGPAGSPAAPTGNTAERQVFVTQADAPPCPDCGGITTRNGACYRCANCGTSIGCS